MPHHEGRNSSYFLKFLASKNDLYFANFYGPIALRKLRADRNSWRVCD